MKYSKKSIQSLFTLIIIAFLVIPLIYIVFKIDPTPNEEGYTNYEDLANKNKNMDRVDISGVTINYGGGQKYTGKENEYIYCPAGDVTCPSGHSLQGEEEYVLPSGKKAKSYKYMCKKNSGGKNTKHVTCKNNYLSDASVNKISFLSDGTDVDNVTRITRDFYDITSNSGKTKLVGTKLKGFTDPYTEIPFEINGEYVHLYKDKKLDIKSSPCFLYEDPANCEKYLTEINPPTDDEESGGDDSGGDDSGSGGGSGGGDSGSGSGSDSSDSNGTCQHQNIKCLADNGSSVGDPLCCGQNGVLQDIKYNCPSEYPYCVGYKCGETWGRCTNQR